MEDLEAASWSLLHPYLHLRWEGVWCDVWACVDGCVGVWLWGVECLLVSVHSRVVHYSVQCFLPYLFL